MQNFKASIAAMAANPNATSWELYFVMSELPDYCNEITLKKFLSKTPTGTELGYVLNLGDFARIPEVWERFFKQCFYDPSILRSFIMGNKKNQTEELLDRYLDMVRGSEDVYDIINLGEFAHKPKVLKKYLEMNPLKTELARLLTKYAFSRTPEACQKLWSLKPSYKTIYFMIRDSNGFFRHREVLKRFLEAKPDAGYLWWLMSDCGGFGVNEEVFAAFFAAKPSADLILCVIEHFKLYKNRLFLAEFFAASPTSDDIQQLYRNQQADMQIIADVLSNLLQKK